MLAPKKEADWGGASTGGGVGWGDPRSQDPRTPNIDPRDMRPDIRDMRTGNSDNIRMMDPREQMRLAGSDMRGDPRGESSNLASYSTLLLCRFSLCFWKLEISKFFKINFSLFLVEVCMH